MANHGSDTQRYQQKEPYQQQQQYQQQQPYQEDQQDSTAYAVTSICDDTRPPAAPEDEGGYSNNSNCPPPPPSPPDQQHDTEDDDAADTTTHQEEDESAPLLGEPSSSSVQYEGSAAFQHLTRTTQDRLASYCFTLLGLGTLLPWNFFITANAYWMYKFRDSFDPVADDSSLLQWLYTPMLVFCSQCTNFLFLILNAILCHKFGIRSRLMSSLSVMLIFFIVTTAFVKINTDAWQIAFFVITIFTIVILNASGAIFQGGLFGLAGMIGGSYIANIINGQAAGGVFSSVSMIVALWFGSSETSSAFTFFGIAVAVMFITLVALVYLISTDLYKETMARAKDQQMALDRETQPLSPTKDLFRKNMSVFKEIYPMGLSVSCVFWVTLAMFPAMCVKIQSTSDNDIWKDTYFQPTLTFLLFNVGDLFGRIAAGFALWPRKGSRLTYLFVGLRLIFIPLVMMCNHGDTLGFPILFSSDVIYGVIMALFSLSNGYLGSICMIHGPNLVSNPVNAERAGSLMAAMLGFGLLLGAITSFLLGIIF